MLEVDAMPPQDTEGNVDAVLVMLVERIVCCDDRRENHLVVVIFGPTLMPRLRRLNVRSE